MTGSHEARGSSPLSSTIYDSYKVGQTADLFYLAGTGRSRPTAAASACRHAVSAAGTPGAPGGRMNPGLPAGPPRLDIASRLA